MDGLIWRKTYFWKMPLPLSLSLSYSHCLPLPHNTFFFWINELWSGFQRFQSIDARADSNCAKLENVLISSLQWEPHVFARCSNSSYTQHLLHWDISETLSLFQGSVTALGYGGYTGYSGQKAKSRAIIRTSPLNRVAEKQPHRGSTNSRISKYWWRPFTELFPMISMLSVL